MVSFSTSQVKVLNNGAKAAKPSSRDCFKSDKALKVKLPVPKPGDSPYKLPPINHHVRRHFYAKLMTITMRQSDQQPQS